MSIIYKNFYCLIASLLLQIEKIKKDLYENTKTNSKAKEINPTFFSSFINRNKLIEEFKINSDELNNLSEISGAIYNRLALKDLK